MARIVQNIEDKNGNIVLPITSTYAIFDAKGNRLDRILDGFGISLDDFEDYELKEDNTKVDPPSLPVALHSIKNGIGVNNILSYTKASLLGLRDNINELGTILESKNKAFTFVSKKEMDGWLLRNKTVLDKGDLLLTNKDKDYWWDGENVHSLKGNVSQEEIDRWNSILSESKEYTDSQLSNIVDIDIKVIDKLPEEGLSKTLYLLREYNAYKEYMYIDSSWTCLGEVNISLSNIYNKQEVEELISTRLNETINISIQGKEYEKQNFTISSPGWYRIAKFEGYTNILNNGSLSNGCNISIRKNQLTSSSEYYDIEFINTNSRKQFILNNKSNSADHDIISIRNVYNTDENISYLDIYYNGSTENGIYVELNNISYSYLDQEYRWEIYDELEAADDISDVLFEICKLDLDSMLDLNGRIDEYNQTMKDLSNDMKEMSASIEELSNNQLDEETIRTDILEELFPVGAISFQKYDIGEWEEVFTIQEDVIIYRRIS